MGTTEERVMELSRKGCCCSQVVLTIAGLDPWETESEETVRAAGGLGYGMYCQHTCGSLLGGAMALSLHLDRAGTKSACKELSEWFCERFGGPGCSDLIGEGGSPTAVCMESMAETAEKTLELLSERGCLQ